MRWEADGRVRRFGFDPDKLRGATVYRARSMAGLKESIPQRYPVGDLANSRSMIIFR